MSQSPSILPHLQSHSHPAKKPYHAVSHGDAIGNNDDKGATDAGENEASLVSEATSSLPTTEDFPALHCTALTQNPFDQSNEPDNHQETRPATVDPRPTPCRPRSDPHRHLHPRAAQDSTQPHSILTSSAAQPPPKAKPATYDLRRPWLAADAVSTAQSWGGKRRGRMESQARLLCCWPGLSAGAQERWFGIRAGERGGENRAWHCRGDGDGDRGEREQRPRDIHRVTKSLYPQPVRSIIDPVSLFLSCFCASLHNTVATSHQRRKNNPR